ncbi:helix-turn-helix transcriptional regulator [Streptomyces globisporus]|uniref:helix-turn-helix transcriptional regulator n=1 Tax=Streptomyces globisporus TaxID=1908 RepID=UPI003CF7E3DF
MPEQGIDPMQTVARRVFELRKRKGLSAAEVGQKMKDVGFKWDRFTVSNLENGKRQNVTLTEWLALAYVLDVSPLHLLVPLTEVEYKVTPDRALPTARVRSWVRGETPLPETDTRIFRTEKPEAEWSDPDLPEQAQGENEASRHLMAGVGAARHAGLSEDQVVDWIRRAWQLSDTLEGGPDGEGL